jgi:hypothetical protein
MMQPVWIAGPTLTSAAFKVISKCRVVGFEVPTAFNIKLSIIQDVMPCSLVEVRGTTRRHITEDDFKCNVDAPRHEDVFVRGGISSRILDGGIRFW